MKKLSNKNFNDLLSFQLPENLEYDNHLHHETFLWSLPSMRSQKIANLGSETKKSWQSENNSFGEAVESNGDANEKWASRF